MVLYVVIFFIHQINSISLIHSTNTCIPIKLLIRCTYNKQHMSIHLKPCAEFLSNWCNFVHERNLNKKVCSLKESNKSTQCNMQYLQIILCTQNVHVFRRLKLISWLECTFRVSWKMEKIWKDTFLKSYHGINHYVEKSILKWKLEIC